LIAYWQQARRFNLVSAEESKMSHADAVAARQSPPSSATLPPPTRPARKREAGDDGLETAVSAPTPPPPTSKTLTDDAPTRPIVNMPQKTEDEQPAATSSRPLTSNSQQPLWEDLQRVVEDTQHKDEMMPEAIALVQQLRKASTSLLQRRFRIGYTRAARMIDAMEEMGIIGPPTGTSKAREVLLPSESGEKTENNVIEDD
jgi:S-DNA-T family DNA segregation ATPase FtsK/SpoIIIE